ncbi:MAG: carboxypeptidase regulatory-like domain-containing protein, partial [Candidatus Hadarchaeum sp.]
MSKLTPNGSGLVYSTYLGGSSFEYASGIAVDITGCAYVIGETGSSDFPTTIGAFNRALSGGSGVFVTKLNTSGSRMVYSTFLGHGSGRAIAVDASGNAIAIGLTNSADFPTTNGAFDTSYNGQQDIFVTRLNPYGSQLLFSTYLGGTGVESGIGLNRVTMDSSGRSVLAGTTDSADFPVTVGSFDDSYNGGRDTFISAIDPSGNALAYSTFLSKDSEAGAIVTDAVTTGVVYVTGSTGYEAFPVTPGALNLPRSGMYVLKLVMSASTSTISGRVTDANGRGIPGVTVSAGPSLNTTTDANGNYTFTGLPAGTYTIRPEKAPYAFSPALRTVTVPPNATGVDFQAVSITKIQVNQVLGNTTNYVAGKDTAVRVFMSDAVPFDPDHQQLQIYRNGNLITQTPLKPQKFSGRSNVLDFLCDRQECDAWQKGFYTFEARVNGDYLSQPSVEFKERKKLIVLVVPVRAKVGGVDTSPSDAWKTAQEFLLKVYPIAREGVSWEHGREIDATDLDLSTDEGKKELRKRLYDRRSLQCKIALGFGIICYDAILGILPKDSLCPPQQIPCSVSGQSYPDMKMAVVTDTPDLQLVIAHEVGHIIGYSSLSGSGGLGDEYDGRCGAFQCNINPPPSSYVGRNGFSGKCENPISCQFSQAKPWEGKAGMGSKVLGVGTDQDYPFDVAARHALTDSLSFMGAAGAGLHNYWVTPRAYNYLFDNLTKSAQAVLRTQAEGQVLFVSGSIGRDGNVSMEPAYHGMYVTPPITTGEYSLNIAGESGDVLVSQGFNVSFVVLSDPPQDLDEARFGVAVRLPDEARTLRIMRGTTILTEKIITPNAPTLSLTSPTAGQTWAATGNYTIR